MTSALECMKTNSSQIKISLSELGVKQLQVEDEALDKI